MLNQNQYFLKWRQLELKVNLNVPFTIYRSVVNAIPKNSGKVVLKPHYERLTRYYCQHRKNQFYLLLFFNHHLRPSHYRNPYYTSRIYRKYHPGLSEVNMMFKCKVIHNVLPTRATLHRDGNSESPVCNLCNAEEQTLHYQLINCTVTVDFWNLFQDWWYQKIDNVIHKPYG